MPGASPSPLPETDGAGQQTRPYGPCVLPRDGDFHGRPLIATRAHDEEVSVRPSVQLPDVRHVGQPAAMNAHEAAPEARFDLEQGDIDVESPARRVDEAEPVARLERPHFAHIEDDDAPLATRGDASEGRLAPRRLRGARDESKRVR